MWLCEAQFYLFFIKKNVMNSRRIFASFFAKPLYVFKMVEFWEAEQELEFDVHDMILSKNASEKNKAPYHKRR